jgi:serine/threonine protein phosphatase 1
MYRDKQYTRATNATLRSWHIWLFKGGSIIRTLAISDIHGCYDEFNALLTKANYDPSTDKLVLLGDYVDRGQKSKQVIEQVMDMIKNENVVALRGNHDQMMIDALTQTDESYAAHWISNGAISTLISYCGLDLFEDGFEWDKYDEAKPLIQKHYSEHLRFLSELPYYHETDTHVFVHAGVDLFKQSWKETSNEDFIWIREMFYKQPNTNTDKTVVFGHTPTLYLHNSAEIWFSENGDKIGLDGACAYGKQLNLLEINDGEYRYYSVQRGETH